MDPQLVSSGWLDDRVIIGRVWDGGGLKMGTRRWPIEAELVEHT